MKHYIRAYFGGWKAVTKEKADSFIKLVIDNATAVTTEEQRQEVISYHYKCVEE